MRRNILSTSAQALGPHFAARNRPVLGAMLLAGALAGCDTVSQITSFNPFDTSEKYKMELTPEVPAEKLYNEGLSKLQSSDYEGAAKRFTDLDKQHPFSTFAKRGMIMTAFAHYEGKQYDEAITASRRYLKMHPSTPDAAYAQYLLGMSYYNQIPDVTRDQERSEKALVALQELVDRYPKSEYVTDAKFKITVARDQVAGREMEVGRYYLNKRNYAGAINRFRDVVSKYQTTRHAEEALLRLTESYLALGVTGEAQTAGAVLGHNFPDSPWYKEAFALLKNGGLQPLEDRGSWISRAFSGVTRTVGLSR